MRKLQALPFATLAVAVAAASYFPHATAQESADDGSSLGLLEEIVVTARRREENLQDVPIAVTAMSEDFLRTQNITTIENLGTQVPSMRITSAGTDTNTPLISIRGQRPSEAKIELDAAAPMYLNEVVMTPSTGTNLAMYDLQGVQVLKGPQGTLFGRNSTGGAILLTTKRPGEELGGYGEVKVGNYNLIHTEGAIDLPINEYLTTRISARKVERDGFQENIADNALHGEDARGEDSEAVRLSINYAKDNFSNLLVLAQDENKSGAPVAQIVALNTSTRGGGGIATVFPEYVAAVQENATRDDPWEFKSDLKAEDNVKNNFVSNTTEFEFSDALTVKNIIGYRKVERESINDADASDLPISGGIIDYPSYVDGGITVGMAGISGNGINGVTMNPDLNETEAEEFTNELQFLGTAMDDKLDWIVGAYWYKMEGRVKENVQQQGARLLDPAATGVLGPRFAAGGINLIPLAGGASLFPGVIDLSTYSAENTARGLFAETTYSFTDEWSLTTGVRQSWDKREVTVSKYRAGLTGLDGNLAANCVVYGPGAAPGAGAPLPNDACERTESESYSAPTWRVSANYTPEDGVLYYGSVSTGYKAGGFNARGTTDASLTPFDEETVTTFELGHKADWEFDWASVRTNTAIYLQKYDDIQQTVSIPEGLSLATQTINAAKAEIKGLEFDVTVAPTESLLFTLSYSYIDAGYKDNEKTESGITYDISDNDFVYIPEQSLTASGTYTLPVDASLGEMSVTVSAYWQDEMSTHPLAGDFGEIFGPGTAAGWAQADVNLAEDVSKVDSYAVWNLSYDWRNVMGSNFDVAVFGNNITDEEYVMGGLNVIDVFYAGYTYGAPRTYGASMRYTF